ncbi:MAG: TlpA disulfide reductase family protein [Chthoniobacteraceae bacterium]
MRSFITHSSLLTNSPGRWGLAAAIALAAGGAAPAVRAGAPEDWSRIVAMDAGPQEHFTTREKALRVTSEFLATQETAYRQFLLQYPTDEHALDVSLRLAHLLAVKSDLENNPSDQTEATALLDKLAADPALPVNRRGDVEFSRISLFMRGVKNGGDSMRGNLLERIRDFQKKLPTDPRLASLLTETANLFDDQPSKKQGLLLEAQALTKDDGLKHRIDDDLHRISLLNTPLALKFTATNGQPVDVAKLTGKVVVICFFATWSPPSLLMLDHLPTWPDDQVQVIGISLDRDPHLVDQLLAESKITFPIACDGKGWQGRIVRGFSINALPTVWVLDRTGKLRVLNASDDPDAVVQALLREH